MSTDRIRRASARHRATDPRPLLRTAVRGLAAVLLLAAAAAPALAQQDGDGRSAGERIADGLLESPVHVDPFFEPALPEDRQRELAAEIEATGLPFYVVLVPVVQGDDWDGSTETMLQVVRDRMGMAESEPMVAVTNSEGGVRHLRGYEWPWSPESEGEAAVRAVNLDRSSYNASLYTRLSRIVELTEAGEGRAEYERVRAELTEGAPEEPEQEEGAAGGRTSFGAVALVVAPVLAVTAGVAVLVARSRRGQRYEVPATVFEVARTAGEDELRRRARSELVEFGERLSDHDLPLPDAGDAAAEPARPGRRGRRTMRVLRPSADPGQALHHALDAYAAAGTVLDGARDVPDLVGVIALVAEGTAALDGASAPAPGVEPGRLCFFQPLHGPAGPRVRWRQVGRTTALKVPACQQCASAVRAHRAPEVLTVRRDGRQVPYFDEPAERSVWAASGYGAFGGGTLTERVRRGDFTRTRGS